MYNYKQAFGSQLYPSSGWKYRLLHISKMTYVQSVPYLSRDNTKTRKPKNKTIKRIPSKQNMSDKLYNVHCW